MGVMEGAGTVGEDSGVSTEVEVEEENQDQAGLTDEAEVEEEEEVGEIWMRMRRMLFLSLLCQGLQRTMRQKKW